MTKPVDQGGDYTHPTASQVRMQLIGDWTVSHRESFRYYRSGSPFEYDMIRMLYKSKREIEIAK